MALYQLILAYDGTEFSGFQRQGKARTVQSEFENVLRQLNWQEESILFAGRTDAGVHASGQVVSFSLDWTHSAATLRSALNAKLPGDISVLQVTRAEADFHPRYDASSRTYRYTIYHQPTRQPLLDRFAWRVWPELDVSLLNKAAQVFTGRHDFRSFGRPMKPGSSTIREVFLSNWEAVAGGVRYEVKANAFLYHMVRRLVYAQVCIAKGTLSLQELGDARDNQVAIKPGLAPAHGLVLSGVEYDGNRRGKVVEDYYE
jgi:tRNA pseudouridine38-40 synthase